MAETRAQALQKGAVVKEIDGVIASRFDAIEKEMKLQREREEQRDEDLRQVLATLAQMANNQAMRASASGTAGLVDLPPSDDNLSEQI